MKDIDLIIDKIKKERQQLEYEDNRLQLEIPCDYNKELYTKEKEETKEPKRVIIIDL